MSDERSSHLESADRPCRAPGRLRRLGSFAGIAVALSFGAAVTRGAAQTPAPGEPAPAPTAPAAPAARPPRVKILIQTVPPEKAEIRWGGKLLGATKGKNKPFVFERPRDSGPLDLVVRAKGFLPVHTRAHTFSDNKLFVKLTPEDQKHTLFGYRQALPADAGAPPPGPSGGGADAGAPAPVPIGPPVPPSAGP